MTTKQKRTNSSLWLLLKKDSVKDEPVQNVQPETSDQNVSQKNSDKKIVKYNPKPPEDDKVNAETFIGMKDFYDQQISELAADVNAHLNKNRDTATPVTFWTQRKIW